MDYVCYYRVSTAKQGQSGFGLKAQQESIYRFIQPDDHVIHEFREVETATAKGERPELQKALKICRETGAKLIAARMDRLYRNVYLMSQLMESKVEFVFCDFPHASKFNIQILAVLAEYEADRISKNTKLAMAQVKKHGSKSGKPIGNKNGWNNKDRKMGPISRYKVFLEHKGNKMAFAFIEQLTSITKMDSKKLAVALNKNGYQTHLDRDWRAADVCKLKRVFTSDTIRDKVVEFEHYRVDKEIEALNRAAKNINSEEHE